MPTNENQSAQKWRVKQRECSFTDDLFMVKCAHYGIGHAANSEARNSASVGAAGATAITRPSSSSTPSLAASCCSSCNVSASKHCKSSGAKVKPVHGSVHPSLAVPSISVARYFLERVFMLSLIYGYGEPEPG